MGRQLAVQRVSGGAPGPANHPQRWQRASCRHVRLPPSLNQSRQMIALPGKPLWRDTKKKILKCAGCVQDAAAELHVRGHAPKPCKLCTTVLFSCKNILFPGSAPATLGSKAGVWYIWPFYLEHGFQTGDCQPVKGCNGESAGEQYLPLPPETMTQVCSWAVAARQQMQARPRPQRMALCHTWGPRWAPSRSRRWPLPMPPPRP